MTETLTNSAPACDSRPVQGRQRAALSRALSALGFGIGLFGLAWRRNTRRKLEESVATLRQSNRQLEQFAYIASHDLQEPLRMLSGCLRTVSQEYGEQLPPQARSLVNLSIETAQRMQQLINDLLTWSRMDAPGTDFQPVDVNEVFGEAMRNLTPTVQEHAAQITHTELPVVLGQPTQLVQVFQNLIGNGIKFHGDTPPVVHVTAERAGNRWRFSVRDNGIGIQSDHPEAVFEIFQRLHTSDDYPGTGIGLAVCRRIVQRHGGSIWFESEPGRGTTFYFTLPALEVEPSQR
jgi:light-regulated signal transduction histidine kinase (bacteriophytochrome)